MNKAVNFYHNNASEIPKYKKITESKTFNKNVCTSLLTIKVEKTITEGEALNALLTRRRERLLDESASRVKKGSEEVDNLNGFKGELQTILSRFQDIENDLRHSQLWLSGSEDHDQGQQLRRSMSKANDVKKKIREKLGSKLNLGS